MSAQSPIPANHPTNPYVDGWLPGVFLKTALPIILIMSVSGAFVVVDAWFIGTYAGPVALSAVTRIFPATMMLVAIQSLVSNGMASVLARQLGAGDRQAAANTFTGAHLMSLGLSVIVMLAYFGFLARWAGLSGSNDAAATMAGKFLAVVISTSPVAFLLSINIDALRSEGRIKVMTLLTVSATLLNILFNWLLLAKFGWGVEGSALGSALAQALCLAGALAYRYSGSGLLRLVTPKPDRRWLEMFALGLPQSLGFIGISIASALIIGNVGRWHPEDAVPTMVAYGIITRILTFAYLPLMGISIAFQTICGNNIGARIPERINGSIRIGLIVATLYCLTVEAVLLVFAPVLGGAFADDPAIIAEVARILPLNAALYLLAGSVVILSGYFQALGDAPKAAMMGLSRTWLFSIPLSFAMPLLIGETGIWLATPLSEASMAVLAIIILAVNRAKTGWAFGLFHGVAAGK